VVHHLLVPPLIQAHFDVSVYRDALLHETFLVQLQQIRSKKLTVPHPARQAIPRRTTNDTLLSFASTRQNMNGTELPPSTRNSRDIRANPTSHLRDKDIQNSRRRRRTLSTPSAEVLPVVAPGGQSSATLQPTSQIPKKARQIQTRKKSVVEDDIATKAVSSALISLHTLGATARSVPEGALVLCVFLAFALLAATLVLCAGASKEDTDHEYSQYHSTPMAVTQRPVEHVPDRMSSIGRVPPGARPNAPSRRSDVASKSPDSSLNMSRASITSSADSKNKDKEQPLLCPSLVVPKGMDLVFAISSTLNQQRQELDFDILDLQGAPLCRVVVAERGERKAPCCGIFLQTLTRMPLAVVNTEQVYAGTGPPSLCRPNGSLFGVLKHDGSSGYTLKHTSGRRLLEFSGDFRRKSVTAVDSSGIRICVTEPTDHGYQIRIGPRVDAGMVISCLLGIDKLEGFAFNDS